MIVRHLLKASLLVAVGAFLTWATASALEQHAVDGHAAGASSSDQEAYRPPTDSALRRMH